MIFGCWTSVSRKSVLPVVEELNGLLFYPVQYEGEEAVENVFYTGAAPNQQAIPAVDYLMSKDGGGEALGAAGHRLCLSAHHQQDPARLPQEQKGVKESTSTRSTPFRSQRLPDHRGRHQEVLARRQDGRGLHHQRRLQRALLQGTGQRWPEGQDDAGGGLLGGRRRTARRGHQAAGGPPGRLELLPVHQNPDNTAFIKKWSAYAKAKGIAGHKDKPLTNDPMEATYIGINMWKQAVEKAKSTDVDKVIAAMAGQTFNAPRASSKMDEKTTTCTSRCSSARSRPTASSTCLEDARPGQGKPWSPHRRQRQRKGQADGKRYRSPDAPVRQQGGVPPSAPGRFNDQVSPSACGAGRRARAMPRAGLRGAEAMAAGRIGRPHRRAEQIMAAAVTDACGWVAFILGARRCRQSGG